jgi:hypothetical protein
MAQAPTQREPRIRQDAIGYKQTSEGLIRPEAC